MTFFQFTLRNVFRNKRIYAAYFLSGTCSVTLFFGYAAFAFHPELTADAIGGHVAKGLHVAEAIIYGFSFFFVLYSMGSFLQARKKEFGLLLMHGMTNRQLRGMIFLENMIIGFFATMSGIGIGLLFLKLMLLAAEYMMGLDRMLPFYMPDRALILTGSAFLLLFACISLFTVLTLRDTQLIDLMKGATKPKPEPRASRALSMLAAALLLIGYGIALTARGVLVSVVMIPVIILVIAGTYLLFTQLSVYTVRRLKENKRLLLRKTNLLLFADLAYRLKDNARTFFIVSIVSTVAFSAIGSLIGFRTVMRESLMDINAFAFSYISFNQDEHQPQHIAKIQSALQDAGVSYRQYQAKGVYQLAEGEQPVMFIKSSEYNIIAKAAGDELISLTGNQAVKVVPRDPVSSSGKEALPAQVSLPESGYSIRPIRTVTAHALPILSFYYVVGDDFYQPLAQTEKTEEIFLFDVEKWQETKEVGAALAKIMPEDSFLGAYRFFALAHEFDEMTQFYSAILSVGFFIGVFFFVGAGSFLYFRLYTDTESDQKKFSAIRKLGLTDRELSKVITAQIAILFFVPVAVALIHGAVALTALHHMFAYSLLQESSLVLGGFLLVQVMYFVLIRIAYLKQMQTALR